MSKRLLLLGGGHAHMQTLAEAAAIVGAGHELLLVSPSPYYYYTGMGPGAFGGRYAPEELRLDLKAIAEYGGGRFVQGRATRIDARNRIVEVDGAGTIGFDVLSCSVGSGVMRGGIKLAGASEVLFPIKPIERLLEARQRILSLMEAAEAPVRVLVIGGGAGAVEVAGNACCLAGERFGAQGAERLHIRLVSDSEILPRFPKRLRRLALSSLRKRGVDVSSAQRVLAVEGDTAILDGGERVGADVVLLATGIAPSPLFRDSGLSVGNDGGLLVNGYLQSVDSPLVFGGGDCISFQPQPLDRVGVYAERQNPVLSHNLRAALDDRWKGVRSFHPGGRYLLALNMGDGTGLVARNGFVLGGRKGLRLKEFLDRRFVTKHRVQERAKEPISS